MDHTDVVECPFCKDYAELYEYPDTKGIFVTSDGMDMVRHIYEIHDDLTVKDIIRKLVNMLA